jgi:3-hydroxyisobutyrate dehydrogenase-like beta-hydroxyacid dehydrogenase
MVKDIDIAMKLAAVRALSLPVTGPAERLWNSANEASEAGCSISEMVR